MESIIYYKDLYNFILTFLNPSDFLTLSKVSHNFNDTIQNNIDYKNIKQVVKECKNFRFKDICTMGFINLIKFFDLNTISFYIDDGFINAAKNNKLEMMNFCKSFHILPSVINIVVTNAIKVNNFDVLNWLLKYYIINIDKYIISDICFMENIKMLDWLKLNNQNLVVDVGTYLASKYGLLNVIKWYDDNGLINNYDNLFYVALHSGKIEIIDMFYERHNYIPPNIDHQIIACVTLSNCTSLEWLYNHYIIQLSYIAELAMDMEKIAVLYWLKIYMKFNFETIDLRLFIFKRKGHALQWFSENVCEKICIHFKDNFPFKFCEWLRERMFYFDLNEDTIILSLKTIIHAIIIDSDVFLSCVVSNTITLIN